MVKLNAIFNKCNIPTVSKCFLILKHRIVIKCVFFFFLDLFHKKLRLKMVNQNELIETETNECEYKSIPQFFSGKNVFVTGATGFLGKV